MTINACDHCHEYDNQEPSMRYIGHTIFYEIKFDGVMQGVVDM